MRHIKLTLIGFCVVLMASVAIAKDKKAEKPMDPQAMMEVYAKLATAWRAAQVVCKSGR